MEGEQSQEQNNLNGNNQVYLEQLIAEKGMLDESYIASHKILSDGTYVKKRLFALN